jgi:alpha-ketoglutarate-dependent taurine dioxygenase
LIFKKRNIFPQHYTQPAHALEHRWRPGDLVVYDNRCTMHCGSYYDSEKYPGRVMWRLTCSGNPGPLSDWDGGEAWGADAKL